MSKEDSAMVTRNGMLPVFASVASLALSLQACDTNHPAGTPSGTSDPNALPRLTNAEVPAGADPLAGVLNKDRLKEPNDEVRIEPGVAVTVASGFTVPLRAAPRGDRIASLRSSTSVSEVARDPHGDYYLVVYSDPGDATKRFAGWVYKDAVEGTAWTLDDMPASPPARGNRAAVGGKRSTSACGTGEAAMRTDHDFCAKPCRDDGACSRADGETCDGLAFEAHPWTSRREAAFYCVAGSTVAHTRTSTPGKGEVP
jgi:hypothetical protein